MGAGRENLQLSEQVGAMWTDPGPLHGCFHLHYLSTEPVNEHFLRVGLFTGTGSMHLALLLTLGFGFAFACQLPSEWRPLSESCRAELAEIIVYAKVLAIHEEPYASSLYNYLPYQKHERAEDALLYAAEVEMLCDQAWGSMLEVPAGSRLNLTGLGYFSCHSHTVMKNNSYIFFLRWVHFCLKTKNQFLFWTSVEGKTPKFHDVWFRIGSQTCILAP